MMLVPYTEEEVDLIAALLKDGLSARKIAAEVGRSKSAIIGKVDRHPRLRAIGFANRSCSGRVRGEAMKPCQPRKVPAKTGSPKLNNQVIDTPQAFKPGRLPTIKPIELPSLELPLEELDPKQCKFATNDAAIGEDHLFCGQPVRDGSSYCSCHHARVYVKAPVIKSFWIAT